MKGRTGIPACQQAEGLTRFIFGFYSALPNDRQECLSYQDQPDPTHAGRSIPPMDGPLFSMMKPTRLILWILLLACIVGIVVSQVGWVHSKNRIHGDGQAVSFSKNFHISLENTYIVFYSDDDCGPYCGSMLSFGATDAPTVDGFGMWAGIYFRDIRWPNGDRLWTLFVTLWYPMVALGLATVIYEYRQSRLKQNGVQRHPLQRQ